MSKLLIDEIDQFCEGLKVMEVDKEHSLLKRVCKKIRGSKAENENPPRKTYEILKVGKKPGSDNVIIGLENVGKKDDHEYLDFDWVIQNYEIVD